MTEHELRLLVREAIAAAGHRASPWPAEARDASEGGRNASFGQFAVPSGTDQCIIEPSVPCTHCGYCKSYGH
jgi:hypothetical protein